MIPITLMLPSRNRPKEAKEATESAFDMAANPDRVVVALRTDADDDSDYSNVPASTRVSGPRIGCSPCYQELSRWVPGDLTQVFADDVRFRTYGWDEIYEDVYNRYGGRPFALYPVDGHTNMATHPAVSRAWLQLFGGMWGAPFEHFYSDTWIDDVAKRGGCLERLDEVLAEHVSPKYGKMHKDQTWYECRGVDKFPADKKLYTESKSIRDEWVHKLKEIHSG